MILHAPRADHRPAARPLVAVQVGHLRLEQPAELARDRLVDLARQRILRDEGREPAERGLLLREDGALLLDRGQAVPDGAHERRLTSRTASAYDPPTDR